MKKTIIFGLFLVSILVLSGCNQQTKYVCPDGKIVQDSSKCTKQKVYCVNNKQCEDALNDKNAFCEGWVCNIVCLENYNCDKVGGGSCQNRRCMIIDPCAEYPELCNMK